MGVIMFKILFIFLAFFVTIYAKEVRFQETRYIHLANTTILKNGIIHINQDNSTLKYRDSNTKYFYTQDYVKIDENQFKHDEQMELSLFFMVMEAIYKNNTHPLKKDFSIIQNDVTTLLPSGYLSYAINKIIYKVKNDKLEYLTIYFKNSDSITIEEKVR
jgi:hypothetical protein